MYGRQELFGLPFHGKNRRMFLNGACTLRVYIVILEYGNQKAVDWLQKHFKQIEIKKVICQSKHLSAKSANFWAFIFNLKKDKVLCLKKSFQNKQKMIWPY